MSKSDDDLAREVERELPGTIGRLMRWLRMPSSRWMRIPAGIVLVAGGCLSFLPVLGLWMIPLGLLLLAQDLPFLRQPAQRALHAAEHCWIIRRKARREHGRR